jgi:glycosyltransferase involved in cell wall biosynthesis
MRIVYLLASLGIGGAERQVISLAERMARRGHAVAIVVLRPPVAEQWPTTVKVIHLDMRKTPAGVLAAMARGRRFLAGFRPSLLHSHSFHANVAARLLGLSIPSLPVLSSVHSVNEGGRLRMLAYHLTDSLSRRTTAVSQAAADRYVSLRAIPPRKCIVLPNGIDSAEFVPNPSRRTSTRAVMGVASEFVWLAAGRIVPAKDYPNLLRAFQNLIQLQPMRDCGLPVSLSTLHPFTPWPEAWASMMLSPGSDCAAIFPPCSTPPTDSSSPPRGRECLSPSAKPWPWKNRLSPPT